MTFLPFAHALASRQDLPIPAWLFAWGASIVLIVSFVVLSVAWRKPRFEEARWRPLGAGLSRALLSWPVQILCGLIGVFLLGVAVYSGLRGTEAPDRNFAPPSSSSPAGSASPSSRLCWGTSSGLSIPGARSGASPGRAFAQSPGNVRPTSPTRSSWGAGRPRSV